MAKFVFGCEQSTYSNGWTELYFNIVLYKGENCLEKIFVSRVIKRFVYYETPTHICIYIYVRQKHL